MTSRTFTASTLLLTAVLCAVGAFVNHQVNFYGLYGDATGTERTIASNDRFSKYLYTFNHIPSNYDALLLGSSISATLDVPRFPGVRMYNLSLSAANITDQSLLLEQALAHGEYRLIVFCLNPRLVYDHGRRAGGLERRDWWSGLGSLPLLEDYLVHAAVRMGLYRARFTPWGGETHAPGKMPTGEDSLRSVLSRVPPEARADFFELDEVAIAELAAARESALASGAAILVFYPPVYAPRYEAFREAYRRFEDRTSALFVGGEPVINFNDGRLTSVTTDPANFEGAVHLTEHATDLLTAALGEAIAQTMADQRDRRQ